MIIELLGANDNEIIDGEFVVPDSVTSIGKYAFVKCTGLTSVYYTGDIAGWCSVGFATFNSNPIKFANSLYISGKKIKGDLAIPDGVTRIGNYAFYGCRSLTSVTIPDSVTSIDNYAFYGCTGLKSEIGNYKAFGADMSCRGYKYEIGKWSEEVRDPILCLRGYHYCTNLFDVFNYYYGKYDKDFIICECEVGDVIIEQSGNNKHVTNQIKPIRKLKWKEVLELMNGNKTEK